MRQLTAILISKQHSSYRKTFRPNVITCASSLVPTKNAENVDMESVTGAAQMSPSVVRNESAVVKIDDNEANSPGDQNCDMPQKRLVFPHDKPMTTSGGTRSLSQLNEAEREETSSSLKSVVESPSGGTSAKILSCSSVNEDDGGGGDWSPEIPFRDLNDLRLSVDEDAAVMPQQKGDKSMAGNRVTANQADPCSMASPQQLLHPQMNVSMPAQTTSERSLLPGVSMAVASEEPNSAPPMTVAEQVDLILDQYIEIESNKRMMKENVSWFCLTFRLNPMEVKFRQVKDMVFKSNAVCVCLTWFFMLSSQIMTLPMYVFPDSCYLKRF
jgi:hypothetical protein